MPTIANKLRRWYIYRITSPSGRVYIGITSNFKKRVSCYKSDAKSKQTLVFNSIKKYGYDSHEVKIIDEFIGYNQDAQSKEMFWVRSYMSNKNKYPEQNGLNLTDGGDGTIGYKLSPEKVEGMRARQLGKKASGETKNKMSLARKGRKMNFTHYTPEFRKMMSDRNKGYKHTEDAKLKIGAASRGNKYKVGYKMTPEQIEHRSSLRRGIKVNREIAEKRRDLIIKNQGKPILMYDLIGNLLNEFAAVNVAVKELKISRCSIDRVLKNEYKQTKGYKFKYKNECH